MKIINVSYPKGFYLVELPDGTTDFISVEDYNALQKAAGFNRLYDKLK